MRIHHIGYLIRNLDKARAIFAGLGYTEIGEVVYDEYRDVDVLFVERDCYTIELVSPKSARSVVANLIKKYKNMPYHICYITDNIDMDRVRMSVNGFIAIDEPMPAPALDGRKVCFLMNSQIGMIELLEEKDR